MKGIVHPKPPGPKRNNEPLADFGVPGTVSENIP